MSEIVQKHHVCYLLSLVFLISISFSSFIFTLDNQAYAEPVMVSTPQGTSVPGCEETNECFMPYMVTVEVGGEVIWSNDDSAAHTVTSGNPADGPSGEFDSSLFMASTQFVHTFNQEGTFEYYCMVHPWMAGLVVVGEPNPTLSIMLAGSSEFVLYQIVGASLYEITPYENGNSLILGIDAFEDGQLTIILQREIIDSKIGNNDKDFFVLIDDEEVDFDETTTSVDRTLEISFPAGAEVIEIIGTTLPIFESKPDPELQSCNTGEELVNGLCKQIEQNKPPEIWVKPHPEKVQQGKLITFDASGSSDPDGYIEDYEWWFNGKGPFNGEIVTRTFDSPGEIEVTIGITDNDGQYVEEFATVMVLSSPNGNGGGNGTDLTWIIVGIVIASVAGGAVFAISRLRKSSKARTITTTISEPSSTQKGRECDVCSTTIPEGQNVCPNCGDTYSVKK